MEGELTKKKKVQHFRITAPPNGAAVEKAENDSAPLDEFL